MPSKQWYLVRRNLTVAACLLYAFSGSQPARARALLPRVPRAGPPPGPTLHAAQPVSR